MLTLIHGDNQIASRQSLVDQINQAKATGLEIITLEANKLEVSELQEALGSQSLFGQEKVLVIEGLHSLPTSKRKKTLIQLLVSASQTDLPDVILWEKRLLTKTMLKKFPQAKIKEFKVSQKLWQFLDNLGNHQVTLKKQLALFDTVCQQEEVHFVYLMIIRQIRLLIQAKEGHFSGAPFMITKLRKQATYFSLAKLLRLHKKLFQIETKQKTSTNLLDLKSELDLFLVSLYK